MTPEKDWLKPAEREAIDKLESLESCAIEELVEHIKSKGYSDVDARWAVLHLVDLRIIRASAALRLELAALEPKLKGTFND